MYAGTAHQKRGRFYNVPSVVLQDRVSPLKRLHRPPVLRENVDPESPYIVGLSSDVETYPDIAQLSPCLAG